MSAVFQRADGEARQAKVEFVAMENSGGKESTSWENVENTWNVSIPHSKGRTQKILEDAERERQEGIQGQ